MQSTSDRCRGVGRACRDVIQTQVPYAGDRAWTSCMQGFLQATVPGLTAPALHIFAAAAAVFFFFFFFNRQLAFPISKKMRTYTRM